MVFRSKAPLRIGLAGGGTDVSPYSDKYGGAVINATISHFASANIELTKDRFVELHSSDMNQAFRAPLNQPLPIDGTLDLLKGMYNRVLKDHGSFAAGFRLSTTVEAPLGSGLGTSSTLMVALAGVFRQMLRLSLDNNEIAHYAFDIERNDLGFAGGKQDQYAATFGGMNYMEFLPGDKVIVQPVILPPEQMKALENNFLLYYTALNRESSSIISEQQQNVINNNQSSISAMHALKEQSRMMYEALKSGRLDDIGSILDFGFDNKRKMAANISNPYLEEIYETALEAGASGGKISGAGGGGFMIFYCPGLSRDKVCKALHKFGGYVKPFAFSNQGLITWEEK
jgi:D-glycero-alpha-D-manno-heptose-7-phosphate kinase